MATTITGSGVDNIIDGTITNADINASAAIAGSKVDGSFGKVLQVVQTTFAGSSSIATSSNAFQAIGHSVSITPTQTGSSILFICSGFVPHVNPSASNKGVDIAVYHSVGGASYVHVDGSGSTNNHCSAWKDTGEWVDYPGHFEVLYTPSYSSGNAIGLQPFFRRADSSAVSHYFHHAGGAGGANVIRLIAMEIGA